MLNSVKGAAANILSTTRLAAKTQVARTLLARTLLATTLMVATLLIATFAAAARVEGDETFRWKFRQGESWDVQMTQEFSTVLQSKTVRTSQELMLQWDVLKVLEDGSAEIEQSLKRLVVREGDKVLLDADRAESPANDSILGQRLRALLKVRFVTRMSARGEILEVRIEDSMKEWLRDRLGLDESTVQQTFSQENLAFPTQPLDVGASWTSSSQSPVPGLGTMQCATTFQYVGPETIQGQPLDKFKTSPAFRLEDPKRTLLRQEGSGSIWFDRDRGRIDHAESTQTFDIRLNDSDSTSEPQSNTVTATIRFSDR